MARRNRWSMGLNDRAFAGRYFPNLTGILRAIYCLLSGRKRRQCRAFCRSFSLQRAIGGHMTPAVSTFFVGTEFNAFLYAPVGAEENKMPLSVLSALSRLNVDPWVEAAELSELPKDTAALRLTSLIARLPGGWAQADCEAIANRLIKLLPHGSRSALAPRALGLPLISHSAGLRILLCAALGLTAFLVAASNEPSSRDDHADRPALSTRSPSQAE